METVIPSDYRRYEIETSDGILEFEGKLLHTVDNERRGRPRWAEIELYKYRVTDPADAFSGQDIYLLHTMGHSVVYHRHESPCNWGVEVSVEDFAERAEFPEDLEPCRDTIERGVRTHAGCYPGDWRDAPPGTRYDLEVLRHLHYFCPTAEDVLKRLRRPNKTTCTACGGSGQDPFAQDEQCPRCRGRRFISGEEMILSAPGMRLVEAVRYKDKAIAEAARKRVRL